MPGDPIIEVQVLDFRAAHSEPGPYLARSASDRTDDWPLWYVAGADGRFNGLSFPDQPLAKFTSRHAAEAIADALNNAQKENTNA